MIKSEGLPSTKWCSGADGADGASVASCHHTKCQRCVTECGATEKPRIEARNLDEKKRRRNAIEVFRKGSISLNYLRKAPHAIDGSAEALARRKILGGGSRCRDCLIIDHDLIGAGAKLPSFLDATTELNISTPTHPALFSMSRW